MHGLFRGLLVRATSRSHDQLLSTPLVPNTLRTLPFHAYPRNTQRCSLTLQTPTTPRVSRPRVCHTGRAISSAVARTAMTMESNTNGEVARKRKESPTKFDDRPVKYHKVEANAIISNGDDLSMSDNDYTIVSEDEAEAVALQAIPTSAKSMEWQKTLNHVVKNVVSIHFCQTCSFDTDPAMSSEATGFVVDAEQGYILTNRHVVGSGPFWGYCIFDNHEEVCLRRPCFSPRMIY